jgi:hypothetical protein
LRISSEEVFWFQVTECHAFDSACASCQCQHGRYQQFLLQPSVRVFVQSQSVWRPGCFPVHQGDKL